MLPLAAGTRIADRYRIVDQLGRGGMGVVYRARDEKLARFVALKTLPGTRLGDGEARGRLMREARAAAVLEHPSIARVFDVGDTEDGGAFLVMELVRGKTLREVARAGLEPLQLCDILAQLADALDYAHAEGVIHRDVKPDNAMVREDGRAVLLDFGLAKDVSPALTERSSPGDVAIPEQLTKEGTLIGTIAYLSPEQARGVDVGPWSDLFAFAVTAFESLTGALPWRGEVALDMLMKIVLEEPLSVRQFRPELPLGVDRVFARALAKERDGRYPTGRAFVAALRQALMGDSTVGLLDTVAAPLPTLVPPPPSAITPRARPLSAVLGVAALVLVGVIAVGSLFWPGGATPLPVRGMPEVIACPVFEASGVEEPTGWLGAMGADLACRRLSTRLGEVAERTRVPAELLGLPRTAGEDFPEDPYVQADARARSLVAARELDGYLDGNVRREPDATMAVELALYVGGEVVARGRGRSLALHEAVARALDLLLRETSYPLPTAIDPEVAPFRGTDRVDVALAFDDLGDASLTGVGVETHCRALMAMEPARIARYRGEIRRVCMRWMVEGAAELERPALDRSSPAALALTAPEHAAELDEAEVRAIADSLVDARRAASTPYARAALARGAVALYELLDDGERARDLLITAAADLPRDWYLRVHLVRALLRTPGEESAVRALAAWHPGKPEAWRTLALPHLAEPARAVPWLERAYLSGGALPLYGIFLSHAHLRLGHDDAVRVIAARYATEGREARLSGEYLRARLELEDGRFGAAFARLEAALREQRSFGRFVDGDTEAAGWLLRIAEVLEREAAAADPLARRFVLAEPHRLLVDQPHYEVPTISLCLHASPDVARPCLARLSAIRAARRARAGRMDGAAQLLEGATRLVEGDDAGTVRAWRPLSRRRLADLDPRVFERAGEPEIAARIETFLLGQDTLAGASMVHVREARRAAAADDTERARALARQVIDAWSASDVPVPAVSEMRELLAALPSRAALPAAP